LKYKKGIKSVQLDFTVQKRLLEKTAPPDNQRVTKYLITIAMLFIMLQGRQSAAQNQVQADIPNERLLPKSFSNSVIYGIGAGTLVGIAASTNVKKNFTQNFDASNVFRGASYGLYGGIILGLYLTYFIKSSTPEKPTPETDETPAPPTTFNLRPNGTYTTSLDQNQKCFTHFDFTPLVGDQGRGYILTWSHFFN
jgi:hypothetical protein